MYDPRPIAPAETVFHPWVKVYIYKYTPIHVYRCAYTHILIAPNCTWRSCLTATCTGVSRGSAMYGTAVLMCT
jgi:hypothetical protein